MSDLFSGRDTPFTPGKSMPPETNPPTSSPLSSSSNSLARCVSFVIQPPVLTLAQKNAYKMAMNSSLKTQGELKVDEVIGEQLVDGILYYFARFEGGIAYKYPSQSFVQQFGSIVEQYKRKKVEGNLLPFDPSASYIHPLSRVKTIINISKRSGTAVGFSYARGTSFDEVVPDSEDEGDFKDDDSGSEDNDGDEYDDSDMLAAPRRSGRSTKSNQVLPFSPKKTRSRRIPVIDSDHEHDADSDQPEVRRPTRRSTRTKKGVKINLDAETYSDDPESGGETSDDYASRELSKRKKSKKVVRPKAARPAYGHFRAVGDLDYDYSDDESMPIGEHRAICEKCHQGPAHKQIEALSKKAKSKGKKKKTKTLEDEFEESENEEERLTALGGWVRCLKCPVVAHWRCLAATQRDEILRAAKDKDREDWERSLQKPGAQDIQGEAPGKRPGLDLNQTTEFVCGGCMKGSVCMGCMEVAIEPDAVISKASGEDKVDDAVMSDSAQDASLQPKVIDSSIATAHSEQALLFRCFTCKRVAHYQHLPLPPTLSSGADLEEIVEHYTQTWLCADCSSYRDGVDRIIAWRPYPPNAVEPPRLPDEIPNYKSPLPREYLVKWLDRSFRRVQWVPHMWLVSTHKAKLKNFLTGGSKVELLKAVEQERDETAPGPIFEIDDDSRASSTKPGIANPFSPLEAAPDAEKRIPSAWKTIDRILEVRLWKPQYPKRQPKRRGSTRKGQRRSNVVGSDADAEELDEGIERERVLAFECGEQPDVNLLESVSDWEARTSETFTLENISQVVWAFIKWNELGYDEATWDSPPQLQDEGYEAFQHAMKRFIESRDVIVPRKTKTWCRAFDNRSKEEARLHLLKEASDLNLGQRSDLKLMPFQVDGFNWLLHNWWTHQHCILADEMGLGKTVQIATFLGYIIAKFEAFPALVVVPNSTITNWVREFERWAPNLRVVPFYGETKARDVIKRFELSHDGKLRGEIGVKYHVLITTYESLLNLKDFTPVFKSQSRWEVLVVDEGQRLKSDTSLLFKRLNELNSMHRIIMTGTPLNNNIRELFNLMNFLDPDEWNDLEALEKEHEELTEELVKQLHNRLRRYFLRRLKSEVLQLPPKNEVIVPLSMAPLQKQVYRTILSRNAELLNVLTQPSGSKANNTATKGGINNVLMQLRKCLQHPYLYAEDIEPRGLSDQETHEKLIDGSTKLRLLRSLLPKLKARGHRVLLFSQFVIALNVIEDFLVGEGHKFLRLDGSTKGGDRQKGMDEFNKPGSDVFVYLLTTRAGGVGINLFSADTVIIFDPDFNPHQDLQAIARAYRFGQQKTCLVFKLMVKDSAEERIVQVGKKKLVLDHLIVQKMDGEENGEDVQSILTFGAQALFDADNTSRDIIYTDNDIDKLIERTEKEGEQEVQSKEGVLSFSFAKIWEADKDSLAEVEDQDQGDSWAQTLQKITAEQEKTRKQETMLSGRGVRRRAAIAKPNAYVDGTPVKQKAASKSSKSGISDGSAFSGSDIESDATESANGEPEDGFFELPQRTGKAKATPSYSSEDRGGQLANSTHTSVQNGVKRDVQYCGLCATTHAEGPGECFMTDRSEHLAEFRKMLLTHSNYEPVEQRKAAILAIDETLYKRGALHLIAGQPLLYVPLDAPTNAPPTIRTKVAKSVPKSGQAPRGSKPDIPAVPQPQASVVHPANVTQPVAGPSKRAASPLPDRESKKKKKSTSRTTVCLVCGQSAHRVKHCPVVAEGPQTVSGHIKRLENSTDPGSVETVGSLRKILLKQMNRGTKLLNLDKPTAI